MQTLTRLLVALSLVAIVSCSPRLLTKDYDEVKVQKIYSDVVGDAAKPQPWEISQTLTQVIPTNDALVQKTINGIKHILVATWQNDTTYYVPNPSTGYYNTGNYPIWVTLAPQLQQQCQTPAFGRREGLDLRLKQLLGLPPDTKKQYFVEFWVQPKDLFRPCPDPEITDGSCDLAFPADVSEDHKEWINDLRLASYYNPDWNKNYPWTELGYTYDWNRKNKTNIGLSEFVVQKNSNLVIHNISRTEEYCEVSK
ncbi:hypothetical protein [Lewinella cohaerens]|uniref:hypothetical protein n=1 Tax=Lewinella cohaerens TaxID=70995 RepID=UPI00036EC767|nr:hypothetical protein [Lewinella cohaerens]